MKLRAIEILIFQCRAEEQSVLGGGDGVGAEIGIIRMDVVNKTTAVNIFKQRLFQAPQLVPSHVRHLHLRCRFKFPHVCVKQSDTRHVALFRVATHHLHAHANAEHRAAQILYHRNQIRLLQILHRLAAVSHAWQQNVVGATDDGGVRRDLKVRPQTLKRVLNRTQIPHFIVDDCYHNWWCL